MVLFLFRALKKKLSRESNDPNESSEVKALRIALEEKEQALLSSQETVQACWYFFTDTFFWYFVSIVFSRPNCYREYPSSYQTTAYICIFWLMKTECPLNFITRKIRRKLVYNKTSSFQVSLVFRTRCAMKSCLKCMFSGMFV